MKNYQEKARQFLKQYLDRLSNYEESELRELARRWGVVSSSLQGMIDELSKIEVKSVDELYRLDVYQRFLLQSKAQSELYFAYAAGTIADAQLVYAESGLKLTQKLISQFGVDFNELSIDSVTNMIGKTSEGAPLYDLLYKSYPESVTKITDELVRATAVGQNPYETARNIKQYMDFNGKRALTIARTEQMQVQRETSLMQMKESGVVKAWQRWEADDAPDEFCQEMNGKIFQLDEPFDTHPNCRGSVIPLVNLP